jgi:hypothetical protein
VQNVNFRDLFRLLYLLNVETSEALKKYQNQQQTMRLYAPIAGFVQEISINTIGGVLCNLFKKFF